MARNLYDLVGVPPVAPREMVASACRRRLEKLGRETTEAARIEAQAIRDAWTILGDDKLRAGYDASLAVAREDATGKSLAAEIEPRDLATELTRPRHLWAENWERYRKLVYAILVVGFFALSAVYGNSRRVAHDLRLQAAEYEAEHGVPPPHLRKPEPARPPQPQEPFSAEKFEQELKEREAQIREQVAQEQSAQEDAFREKNRRENDPYAGRRRSRSR